MALEKEPYKGVRDFYPKDMAIQNYIFEIMRDTAEAYGYEEYSASILEPSELYKAKSGDELINQQTYTFTDRGGRDVTLRPEMTPTVARMIAKKRKEFSFPLRWFSIPNFFRYERPQKGRLREFWQLNVDIFGVEKIDADIEIINIAYDIMRNFGVTEDKFEIRINDRSLVDAKLKEMGLDEDQSTKMKSLIDKKDKMDNFDQMTEALAGKPFSFELDPSDKINTAIKSLNERGISNVVFAPNLMRGFDYYTGIVFEIFDKSGDNNRALFGGGRYDNLLEIFDEEKVPAVGFGMGDVTMRDVLETYNLIPEFTSSTDISICVVDDESIVGAQKLASTLRDQGLNIIVDSSLKKIGDQIKKASKNKIRYVICVGSDEISKDIYKLKDLSSGEEKEVAENQIADSILG